MRLALFFTLSLALHASVLAYPIRFHGWKQDLLIAVTIMPMASDTGAGTYESGQEGNRRSASHQQRPQIKPAEEVVAFAPAVREPVPIPSSIEVAATTNQADMAFTESTSGAASPSSENVTGRSGHGGGNGFGSTGAGSGSSSGTGLSAGGSLFIQARYRNTPQPVYPENARREGREGRVLLHVLIDDHGKSKTIEVNRSSGSAALDRAAAEAISHWRFHPALAGEKPVETWVTIPIDFRLMDERN